MRLSEELASAIEEGKKETFIVYRLGSGSGKLDNRNAANALGLISYMNWVDERGWDVGDTISVYRVTAEKPFGRYVEFQGGGVSRTSVGREGLSDDLSHVGVRESDGAKQYSFPKGGAWTAKKLKSITSNELSRFADPNGKGKPLPPKGHYYKPNIMMLSYADQAKWLRKMFGDKG